MANLTNQDIIEALIMKAEKHERIAKSFRDAIQNLEAVSKSDSDLPERTTKMMRTKWPAGTSYETHIISILHDGMPRSARQLHVELVNRLQKNIQYNTFSGRLSQIIKDKGNIKKHEIPKKPLSKRYYYGLKEWFDGNRLKDEYMERIR